MLGIRSQGKLKTKLLLIFFSVGITLLITTVVISLWVFRVSLQEIEKNVEKSLDSTSQVLAKHIDASVFFELEEESQDLIMILEGKVTAAVVHDENGKQIAVYAEEDKYKRYLLQGTQKQPSYITTDDEIIRNENLVGRIQLLTDLTPQIRSIAQRIIIIFLILISVYIIIAFILYYVLSNLNKRFDSLVSVTKKVHDNRQLNFRVLVEGNDEVTTYSNYFNAMLDVIELQTKKLETFNLQLAHQILHDKLCDLPNREYLRIHIRTLIKKYNLQPGGFSVMELDIDRFKEINDQYGHHAGDEAILALARVLRDMTTSNVFSARLGGDEFVVVIDGDITGEIIQKHFQSIREQISTGYFADYYWSPLTLSGGVSICPEHGTNIIQLLKTADVALYNAKQTGRNRVCVYEKTYQSLTSATPESGNSALLEVNFDFIEPIFQPIYELDGRLFGVECLATYQPEQQVIRAEKFIESMEEQGLIDQLDLAMLSKSLDYTSKLDLDWHMNDSFKIFHNFSVDTLSKPGFVDEILHILKGYGIKPESLVIEVTETLQLNQFAIDNLNKLSDDGAKLCIDDFGAGFTNPAYFRDVTWDYIKIDKKYINDLSNDSHTLQLIDSLFNLSKLLNIEVVAEGVEKPRSIEVLSNYGCRYFQGYYFGKPWSYSELKENYTKMIGLELEAI